MQRCGSARTRERPDGVGAAHTGVASAGWALPDPAVDRLNRRPGARNRQLTLPYRRDVARSETVAGGWTGSRRPCRARCGAPGRGSILTCGKCGVFRILVENVGAAHTGRAPLGGCCPGPRQSNRNVSTIGEGHHGRAAAPHTESGSPSHPGSHNSSPCPRSPVGWSTSTVARHDRFRAHSPERRIPMPLLGSTARRRLGRCHDDRSDHRPPGGSPRHRRCSRAGNPASQARSSSGERTV